MYVEVVNKYNCRHFYCFRFSKRRTVVDFTVSGCRNVELSFVVNFTLRWYRWLLFLAVVVVLAVGGGGVGAVGVYYNNNNNNNSNNSNSNSNSNGNC